jgi:integrase
VTGLTLVPGNKKGKGNWNLRFVSPVTHKRRDMGLGTYPSVKIETARRSAMDARELIASGKDPVEERKLKRTLLSKAPKIVTFEEAAREKYGEKLPGWKNPKHAAQWIRTLEAYVFPVIGKREVSTLKPADFAEALKPIWLTKPETASRVRQRCHDTMKWCLAHELVTGNPVDFVEHILGPQPAKSDRVRHQPAMAWRDIPDFVEAVLRVRNDISRTGLEFLILTAARSEEVRGATWDEIDFEKRIWTVPAARMKRKKEHVVPLSNRALEILSMQKQSDAHPTLVFPSPRGKVLTDMAFTVFLRKHKVMSSNGKDTATAHGFRSSFRDWASENGYPRDLAEKALAHAVRDKTEAAYHRTELVEERRQMMEDWAKWVCSKAKNLASDLR